MREGRERGGEREKNKESEVEKREGDDKEREGEREKDNEKTADVTESIIVFHRTFIRQINTIRTVYSKTTETKGVYQYCCRPFRSDAVEAAVPFTRGFQKGFLYFYLLR